MKDTPNLEIFLKIINQPLWDWAVIPGRDVRIDCPNQDAARDFIRNWYESIKIFTFNFDCDRALVRCLGARSLASFADAGSHRILIVRYPLTLLFAFWMRKREGINGDRFI